MAGRTSLLFCLAGLRPAGNQTHFDPDSGARFSAVCFIFAGARAETSKLRPSPVIWRFCWDRSPLVRGQFFSDTSICSRCFSFWIDFRSRGGWRMSVPCPRSSAAWTDETRGSWALGLIVLAIFIAGGLVEGTWGRVGATRWSAAQLRRLGGCLAASMAALREPYALSAGLVSAGYGLLSEAQYCPRRRVELGGFPRCARQNCPAFPRHSAARAFSAVDAGSSTKWDGPFGMYAGLTYVRFLFLAGILAAPLVADFLAFLPATAESTVPHGTR